MEYITVKQASGLWGIKARQVQNLCNAGRVAGAMRFNRSWAIPKDAEKPLQDRTMKSGKSENKPFLEQLDVLKTILDQFPYSVNVTATDGTMVYANEAFFEGTLAAARKEAVGGYNILQEEMLEKWQLTEHIKKAFNGEKVFTPGLKFPNRDLVGSKYAKNYAFMSLYNDISSFPIFNEEGALTYVVSVFIPVRKYMARDEIADAKRYIETHWAEPFNTELAAKEAKMSLSGFLKAFRKDTGFSPHDYYIEVKIQHLKEKLLDRNLPIARAFNECGIDYNSYYSSLFKKHTGMTAKQFRKKGEIL